MSQLTNNQVMYRAYLTTPIWQAKRQQALALYGCICSRCKEHGTDVHHKTYDRVGGDELMSDLEVLCRGCHEAHHKAERCAKPRKRRRKGIHKRAIFSCLSKKMKSRICLDLGIQPERLYGALVAGNGLACIMAVKMLGFDYVYGFRRVKRHIKEQTEHPHFYGLAFVE